MSWIEIVGYVAVVLLALAILWITYGIARRLTRSNERASPIVLLAVGGAAVVLSVLVTLVATQEIERHSWPTVVVGHRGMDITDPIYLGGSYAVEWSAIGGQAACHLDATLRGGDGNPYTQALVATSIPARTNTGSATSFLTVDRAAYYVDAGSDCPAWSITLSPRR